MREIGISCSDAVLTEERFRELENSGINAVEIGCFYEPEKADYKKLQAYARRYGIRLWSCHLPYKGAASIARESREDLRQALDIHCGLLARIADIGVDKFVIHPSGLLRETMCRENAEKYALEALDILAEFAHKRGACIAVENMSVNRLGNTCDDLWRMIGVNDKLRVCFDVNHLLYDSHEVFADRFRDKLVTVHISDYEFTRQCHWLPGEGKIDWKALYSKLCRIGYEGVWMYEVGPWAKNDLRSRELTVRDFYNNAMEIFAGKVPARI